MGTSVVDVEVHAVVHALATQSSTGGILVQRRPNDVHFEDRTTWAGPSKLAHLVGGQHAQHGGDRVQGGFAGQLTEKRTGTA